MVERAEFESIRVRVNPTWLRTHPRVVNAVRSIASDNVSSGTSPEEAAAHAERLIETIKTPGQARGIIRAAQNRQDEALIRKA